jgi:protein-disulfide isomerase
MNKQTLLVSVLALALGTGLGFFLATPTSSPNGPGPLSEVNTGSCSAGGEENTPLIQLAGTKFFNSDLPTKYRSELFEAGSESYQKKAAHLKEFAIRYLGAKKKNGKVDLENLPPLVEVLPMKSPSDSEIKEFYEKNRGRLPNVAFDKLKGQISNFLAQQGMGDAFQELVKEYEEDGDLVVLLPKPIAPQVSLQLEDLPRMGNPKAKLVLVEASDYLCGHCQQIQPEVKKVIEKYEDDLLFVQANFSLRPQGKSGVFARAAYCAQKQNKFWKFHKEAFEYASDHVHKPGTSPEDEATKVAKESGLDLKEFTPCLKSRTASNFVEKTNRMLSGVGVHGTPTFFLNNRKIRVAQGELERIIKSELERL